MFALLRRGRDAEIEDEVAGWEWGDVGRPDRAAGPSGEGGESLRSACHCMYDEIWWSTRYRRRRKGNGGREAVLIRRQ